MNELCVICDKYILKDANSLVPVKCLVTYGSKAHRICKTCWFSKFAVEGADHRCPGCLNNKPFTKRKKKSITEKQKMKIIIID